jgi:3-hydroxyacyl-[acyl-carrier-protein] dehydratase
VGIKEVTQNEPVLQGHFPDEPVFPGPLVIEALAQSCGLLVNLAHALKHGGRADRLSDPAYLATVPPAPHTVLVESKIRLGRWVRPGEVLRLECHLALERKDICYFKVRAVVDGAEVAAGEILLARPDYAPPVVPDAT